MYKLIKITGEEAKKFVGKYPLYAPVELTDDGLVVMVHTYNDDERLRLQRMRAQ